MTRGQSRRVLFRVGLIYEAEALLRIDRRPRPRPPVVCCCVVLLRRPRSLARCVGGSRAMDAPDPDETFSFPTASFTPKEKKAAKVIRQYVMGDSLGEGSQGKVREALNSETLRRVAIKIVNLRQLRKVRHADLAFAFLLF